MCGRYYVDDETAREIERIVKIADEKGGTKTSVKIQGKDIHPTDMAPILTASEQGSIGCSWQKWGWSGFDGKQVIFNARSESVLEKKDVSKERGT